MPSSKADTQSCTSTSVREFRVGVLGVGQVCRRGLLRGAFKSISILFAVAEGAIVMEAHKLVLTLKTPTAANNSAGCQEQEACDGTVEGKGKGGNNFMMTL